VRGYAQGCAKDQLEFATACDARAQSPKLAAVNSIDEAVVIGAALSLSSSAFVLQLMAERNELGTRFGSATLGILLFQARPGSHRLPAGPSLAHRPGGGALHCSLP
jgi:predicted Kef-type K+ transport protein